MIKNAFFMIFYLNEYCGVLALSGPKACHCPQGARTYGFVAVFLQRPSIMFKFATYEFNNHDPVKPNGKRFCYGSGSALVSRMRRLFHPGTGAEDHADTGHTQGEYCYYLRHRLQQPFPLLHEYLW